jgi:hypothetical protein
LNVACGLQVNGAVSLCGSAMTNKNSGVAAAPGISIAGMQTATSAGKGLGLVLQGQGACALQAKCCKGLAQGAIAGQGQAVAQIGPGISTGSQTGGVAMHQDMAKKCKGSLDQSATIKGTQMATSVQQCGAGVVLQGQGALVGQAAGKCGLVQGSLSGMSQCVGQCGEGVSQGIQTGGLTMSQSKTNPCGGKATQGASVTGMQASVVIGGNPCTSGGSSQSICVATCQSNGSGNVIVR